MAPTWICHVNAWICEELRVVFKTRITWKVAFTPPPYVGELSWGCRLTPNLQEIVQVIVLKNNRWQLCGYNQFYFRGQNFSLPVTSLRSWITLWTWINGGGEVLPERQEGNECSGLKVHTSPQREHKCQGVHITVCAVVPTGPSKLGVWLGVTEPRDWWFQ